MSETTTAPFAVWLTPAPSDRRWLSKVIQDYAVEYKTPPFEPHVTLFNGVAHPGDDLKAILESVVPRSLVTLEVMGLDYTADFFKTGFITFAPHPRLTQMSQDICDRLSQPQCYPLEPHLSLMYKDLPVEQKRLAMLRFVVSVQTICFDTIKIITPGIQGWWDVAHWTEQHRYTLSRPATIQESG